MKECFYCFEEMAPYEGLCSFCKNRQPLKAEVDKQYRKVIRRLAISGMGFKEILWVIIFWTIIFSALVSLAVFALIVSQPRSSANPAFLEIWEVFAFLGLVLSAFFVIKIYKISLRDAVSTKGYFIEKFLREKLKSL